MTTPVRRLLWMLITVTLATPGLAADTPGPVAAWNCDEGQGSVVHDTSGKNHGRIHGAEWVAAGAGHALRFDGVDDHVDCGNDPSLDLRGPLTLIAWVHPDKPAIAEPGVVGKFFETYALTYYKTGSCYLYISSGGNNVNGSVTVGQWSHVAGVFDGRAMRFYVNGRETSSRKSGFPAAKPGGRFRMGCVVGDRPGIDERLVDLADGPVVESVGQAAPGRASPGRTGGDHRPGVGHAAGCGRGAGLAADDRGSVGNRADLGLRRQQLPGADCRRGPRLGHLRSGRGSRKVAESSPSDPVHRFRGQEGLLEFWLGGGKL